jgi:16S rRNA (guanine527-N7)-methyltransferase
VSAQNHIPNNCSNVSRETLASNEHHQVNEQNYIPNGYPNVSRETLERLVQFQSMVIEEGKKHNLVAKSTLADIWQRHILDSLQLCAYGNSKETWLDIGSGAGFPGVVVAIVRSEPVILVEPRPLRAQFLQNVVKELNLENAHIESVKIEKLKTQQVGTISARALAPLDKILQLAHRFSSYETIWVLPKGKSAEREWDEVKHIWEGKVELKLSRTSPEAQIIIASHIMKRNCHD